MTFADLAHDIEARVREKLPEADKNRFQAGPDTPSGDTTLREFAIGEKRSKLELDGGRVYVTLAGARESSPGDRGFALDNTSIEPVSESIYEFLRT